MVRRPIAGAMKLDRRFVTPRLFIIPLHERLVCPVDVSAIAGRLCRVGLAGADIVLVHAVRSGRPLSVTPIAKREIHPIFGGFVRK